MGSDVILIGDECQVAVSSVSLDFPFCVLALRFFFVLLLYHLISYLFVGNIRTPFRQLCLYHRPSIYEKDVLVKYTEDVY